MNTDPTGIDPAKSPPAIVRPHYADRLAQLMAEAQAFGRKTIEQKIATGRKLTEAFEEWESRNASAKPKDRVPWARHLKRFGFSERTERRLRTAAKSHAAKMAVSLLKSQAYELDAIYDDGVDPDADPTKKPCRECRVNGKAFSSKCAACRAFNRAAPKPKDDKPPVDMDGNLLPEHVIAVFQEGEVIRELTGYLTTGTKALSGIAERAGCAAIAGSDLPRRLARLKAYALKYRPGLVHDECDGRGCDKCDGRGWFTVMKILDDRAKVANEKKRQKDKERFEQRRRSNEPLPE